MTRHGRPATLQTRRHEIWQWCQVRQIFTHPQMKADLGLASGVPPAMAELGLIRVVTVAGQKRNKQWALTPMTYLRFCQIIEERYGPPPVAGPNGSSTTGPLPLSADASPGMLHGITQDLQRLSGWVDAVNTEAAQTQRIMRSHTTPAEFLPMISGLSDKLKQLALWLDEVHQNPLAHEQDTLPVAMLYPGILMVVRMGQAQQLQREIERLSTQQRLDLADVLKAL